MGDKMPSDHHQDIRSLFEAAARNDVEALNSLIRENPRLVSDTASHTDRTTPLHVSASRGHLAFSTSLLSHDLRLATVWDMLGRTPLHVASMEGHVEVVKALLGADQCLRCLAPDKGGRIPLHWAAMRGKYAVVKELVAACPESLDMSLEGDTVLHLAVKYDQLRTLIELVRLAEYYYSRILNEGNREGNTVLHLAVLLEQDEMIAYLLALPKIGSEATRTLNKEGFNAMEAWDNKSNAKSSGDKSNAKSSRDELYRKYLIRVGVRSRWEYRPEEESWLEKILSLTNAFFEADWMTEARAQLIVVSTIITTISFQIAVNPPGGVFQASFTDINTPETLKMLNATQRCLKLKSTEYHKECQLPGNAVFGYFNPIEFSILTVFNTGAFLGSLFVTVVRNSRILYILVLCVAFILESLMITFFLSVDLSIPLLRRTALGLFECSGYLLALGVLSVFFTLVLTWWLLRPLIIIFILCIRALYHQHRSTGGVFQASFTDINTPETLKMLNATQRCLKLKSTEYHKECQLPGNAVFGYFNPIEFSILTVFNTGAFLGSLFVTVVRNSRILYILVLCVAFILESLMITFFLSVDLSIPLLRRTALGLFEWSGYLLALGVFSVIFTLIALIGFFVLIIYLISFFL